MNSQARFQPSIDLSYLQYILNVALRGSREFGEVFVESRHNSSVVVRNSKPPEITQGTTGGGCIRVMDKDTTYFFSGPSDPDSLLQMAHELAHKESSPAQVALSPALVGANPHEVPPAELAQRAKRLQAAVDAAHAESSFLTQTVASWMEYDQRVTILNSQGTQCTDRRLVRSLRLSMMGQREGKTQMITREVDPDQQVESFETLAQELAHLMDTLLEAPEAPAGEMPVVLGPGCAGVLFHEAIGHGLEADVVQQGASIFANQIGQQVAHLALTLVDAGDRPGLSGTMRVDDEGTPTRKNLLIVKGRLTGYLHSLATAEHDGLQPTGNARRQSYLQPPIPRMTNTWVEPGPYDPKELIERVQKGIYVQEFMGGQTDTATGRFAFGAVEAYLICNGRIDHPIRQVTISGKAQEVLRQICMIGDDLQHRPGLCLKGEQMVMTSVGAPTILVEGLVVGGGSL